MERCFQSRSKLGPFRVSLDSKRDGVEVIHWRSQALLRGEIDQV